jgi:hypothetical protein
MSYGNGDYEFSASSSPSSVTYLFNKTNIMGLSSNNIWTSSPNYETLNGRPSAAVAPTTNSATTAYTGEWIDMTLPDPLQVSAYSISPLIQKDTGQPVSFVLLGMSNTNTGIWEVVDDTYKDVPFPVKRVVINVTNVSRPKHSYSRFRVVITRVAISSMESPDNIRAPVVLCQVQLFGTSTNHSLISVHGQSCLVSGRLGVGVVNTLSALSVSGSGSFSGNLGIGSINFLNQPTSYALELAKDSAAKPATSTWTVTSDKRLKTSIVNADLARCYNIVKQTPLRRFTWRDDVYDESQVTDRSKLGWIAQEVEVVFPKAVEERNMHGIEDCRTLNTDQLIAALYGCVQGMQKRLETIESQIEGVILR